MLKAFFSTLLITLGFFSVAVFLLPWVDDLPAGLDLVRHYLPYPVLITAMLLSLSFNQTRLFFVLYLTAIFLVLILGDVEPPAYFSPIDQFKFIQLVFLLYLVAVVFFLYSKERGVLTLQGILRLMLCTALPLIPLWLAGEHSFIGTDWLSITLFPLEISQKLPLPDVTVASYLVAMLILMSSLFFRPGVVESSYFGLLSGAGLALYYFPVMGRVEYIFTVALLIVLVFILRNSFHLAYLDELTGLQGRRALREQMNKLGNAYSIAMIDIDLFKKFNDRYGHDVGDQVLKMVASHIAKTAGGSRAYRYGGEEFTLVFSGKTVDDAKPYLESLRESIAEAGFIVRDKKRPKYITAGNATGSKNKPAKKPGATRKPVKITVSIGVSDNHRTGNSPEEVLKIADKALYRAKKKGRNRIST